jgi:stage II sporulation SpoAA-like protein
MDLAGECRAVPDLRYFNRGRCFMVSVTLVKNFCLVEPHGPLTKEDFIAIAAKADPVIESKGVLDGIVIKTRDFPGWESFSDVVEHFRFVKNHHQTIKKVAIVTDTKVADILPAVVNHFVKAEIKHFHFDDYEKAVEWVG